MLSCQIKRISEISESDCQKIFSAWGITDNQHKGFETSDFYLLYDDSLLAVCKVDSDFLISIGNQEFNLSLLSGLHSFESGKGYGKYLISFVVKELKARKSECIGFCFARNRGFYKKSNIQIFEDAAKHFKGEKAIDKYDDILDINLGHEIIKQILQLGGNNFAKVRRK